jgi:hypothetical protein
VSDAALSRPSKAAAPSNEMPVTVRRDPAAIAFLRQNQAVAATIDASTILITPEGAKDRTVMSHELAHIMQLRSGRGASLDASERAADDYARGVSDDPGGAADAPLFNDGKDGPKGGQPVGFFDDDSEIILNEDDFTTPAVTKSGGRRYIEGRRVPNKSFNAPREGAERLDAQHLVRHGNETAAQAAARVRTVVGRRISETPLAPVWNAVVGRLTRGATPESLGRERVLSIYKNAQGEFWIAVAQDPALVRYLSDAGIVFVPGSGNRAPFVQVDDPTLVPWTERKLNLDHLKEKAIGDNWKYALEGDNLKLETQGGNQNREAKQARHDELRQQAAAPAGLPERDNFVEDPERAAANGLAQPFQIARGNRAVQAKIRGDILWGGPAESLAEQRARRRKGVWRSVAMPAVDATELKGFVVSLPPELALEPFEPVSAPAEDQFILSGDKYGVTIVHPNSETFVRVVEAEDRFGPDQVPFDAQLEADEEAFGYAKTPAIAYQLLAPQDGKPGQVRIVVGPGAFIEVNEPAPYAGVPEEELVFADTRFGGSFELVIVEMPDNDLVPLPGEEIDVNMLQLAGGTMRDPDKHIWRGSTSRLDRYMFWGELIAGFAFALVGFGIGAIEAAAIAEVAAAGPEADIAALTISEVPEAGADIAGQEIAADTAVTPEEGGNAPAGRQFDDEINWGPSEDEGGAPPQGASVKTEPSPADTGEYYLGKYGAAIEDEEAEQQLQYVFTVRW